MSILEFPGAKYPTGKNKICSLHHHSISRTLKKCKMQAFLSVPTGDPGLYLVISDDTGFAITTCHFILSTVLAWFDLSAPFHHLTYHHSSYFFFLIWLFFSFLTSLLFYSTHLVEVYKDVHRRSELIGWADSQSASKERAAQNPSRQEGTGKMMRVCD